MKKLFYIFTFTFLFFLANQSVFAKTDINITCIINSDKAVNNTFTYAVEPANTNKYSATNVPTKLEIEFTNEMPVNNKITKTKSLDFKDTVFTHPGIYEYMITEVSSSNPELYPISNKSYKITLLVKNSGDQLEIEVYDQALDNDNKKAEPIFTYGTVKEPNIPASKEKKQVVKTGVVIEMVPFIVLLLFGILGIMFSRKIKR